MQIDLTEDFGHLLLASPADCILIFADAIITGSKDDEILFFNGEICSDFSGRTFGQDGFVLDASSLFEQAIGSVTVSSEKNSTTSFKWTFKGEAIP